MRQVGTRQADLTRGFEMNDMVLVTGNTYPVKDQLKQLGAKWDAANKGWLVPSAKLADAQALVANAPKSNSNGNPTGSCRPKKCVVCGAVQSFNSRGYPNVKIYRSGECQDCFEERKMGY